jgi:hypothetical protein
MAYLIVLSGGGRIGGRGLELHLAGGDVGLFGGAVEGLTELDGPPVTELQLKHHTIGCVGLRLRPNLPFDEIGAEDGLFQREVTHGIKGRRK